jgi:hypothetical protein
MQKTLTITEDGTQWLDIPKGARFGAGLAGTFDSASVALKYCTGDDTAAALTTSLTGSNNDLVFTAVPAGHLGNSITITYAAAAAQPLTVDVDGTDITVNLAVTAAVAASLTTTLTGADNDLTLTAVTPGTAGNSITLTLADPSANDEPLAVSVTDTGITVTLATDADGDIISTAHEVKLALEADEDAAALVTVAFPMTTAVKAALTTSLTGANNDMVFTARRHGTYGNGITVAYVNPGAPGASLSVESSNKAITVNLATAADTAATLTTSMTGDDNDLVLTAVEGGEEGNDITLTLVDPSDTDQELAVTVTGTDISVSLATDSGGTITTTGALLKAALEADADAAALVTVAHADGNDGSGVVTALSESALTGGGNGEDTISSTAAQIKTAIEAHADASALVTIANSGSDTGAGAVTAMAAASLTGGVEEAPTAGSGIVTALSETSLANGAALAITSTSAQVNIVTVTGCCEMFAWAEVASAATLARVQFKAGEHPQETAPAAAKTGLEKAAEWIAANNRKAATAEA